MRCADRHLGGLASGHAARLGAGPTLDSVVVEPPDPAVPPERARDCLRVRRRHAQQRATGAVGTPLPLLPVPQRLKTNPEHAGELALGRVKLVSNLHNVNLRKLDVRSTSIRPVPREQRTLDVPKRVFKRTRGTGIPRPTLRWEQSFRFFIDESASFAVSMRFRRTIRHLFEQPLEQVIGSSAHALVTSNGHATPSARAAVLFCRWRKRLARDLAERSLVQ